MYNFVRLCSFAPENIASNTLQECFHEFSDRKSFKDWLSVGKLTWLDATRVSARHILWLPSYSAYKDQVDFGYQRLESKTKKVITSELLQARLVLGVEARSENPSFVSDGCGLGYGLRLDANTSFVCVLKISGRIDSQQNV